MTQITEFLFPAPARRTTGAIFGWWEKRRLAYNAFVGVAGMVTVGTAALVTALPPFSDFNPIPWAGVILFGVGANVFYTLGPILESLVEKIWGRQLMPIGPTLYRMGLTFSVGLALFPSLILIIAWIINVIRVIVT